MNENRPASQRLRLRQLSAEEIELWLQVTKSVKPRPGSRLPPSQPGGAESLAPSLEKAEARPSISGERTDLAAQNGLLHTSRKGSTLAPLDRHLRQKLARGRTAPDAVIDLHGFRRQEAYSALRAFLARAQGEGARLVLVVTGKGERLPVGNDCGESNVPGILRQSVPRWLREPFFQPLIAGFEAAQRPHGGTGAFYVHLRRRDRVAARRTSAP
ncbi:MAG TPA: Smr/MutS family protein [Methylocella sp.]|nr:Smr/MutS family protein [Methylocella sp.]